METNSKKVLEALPAFEDFMKLAEEIKMISIRKMKLENRIKDLESVNFRKIMSTWNTLWVASRFQFRIMKMLINFLD